jgi:hypothetical protein
MPKPNDHPKPVGYLHSLTIEAGDKPRIVLDESGKNPYGVRGRDYSANATYERQPLFTLDQAQSAFGGGRDLELSFVSTEALAKEFLARFDIAFIAAVKRMKFGHDNMVQVFKGQPLEVVGLMDLALDMARRRYASNMQVDNSRPSEGEDDER